MVERLEQVTPGPMGVVDEDPRCRTRQHEWSDRRRSLTSSSTSRWSDRPEPSKSLGCPSVARRRSRRRLRNVGRQPSMGVIDVDTRAHPRSHAGKPTPRATRSAVSPSAATDGHPRWLEGSNKSLLANRQAPLRSAPTHALQPAAIHSRRGALKHALRTCRARGSAPAAARARCGWRPRSRTAS
jgi:hypothetical protein